MPSNCFACNLHSEKKQNLSLITETKHFYVEQDYEIVKKGYLVVVSKRHIHSIENLTYEERIEFIDLICNIRKGLRVEFKIMSILLLQRERINSHFHFCIFPKRRMNFVITNRVGKFYFSLIKRINKNRLTGINKENEKLRLHLVDQDS